MVVVGVMGMKHICLDRLVQKRCPKEVLSVNASSTGWDRSDEATRAQHLQNEWFTPLKTNTELDLFSFANFVGFMLVFCDVCLEYLKALGRHVSAISDQ